MDEVFGSTSYILYTIIIIAVVIVAIYIISVLSSQSSSPTQVTMATEPISLDPSTFPFPIYIINLDRKPERYDYVRNQLDAMGITGYERISAVDGFHTSTEDLVQFGVTPELTARGGIAGCASSHIKVWRLIAERKLDWTLILEDDAHFHPNFLELFHAYWKHVPKTAKIIFPGYCVDAAVEQTSNAIIERAVMCLQGYMLSWEGAEYLLNQIVPINDPIDIAIDHHFQKAGQSYIFNGNATVDGIRPNDYKEANGRRCMFNGIIYQNHQEQGSTIHTVDTVF